MQTMSELETKFIPSTVRKRKENLDTILQVLNRRNFKALEETNKEDLEHVAKIVSDMFPENTQRLARDYARVAIKLWNKAKSSQ